MRLDRFHQKYREGDADECWVWLGALTGSGYGNFYVGRVDGRKQYTSAHRFAYESEFGPVPKGLVLDHLCRNRACVNPSHLEPVTNAENIRRGASGILVTHCPKGHALEGDNLRRRNDGRRGCAECLRQRNVAKTGSCDECGTPVMARSPRCGPCGRIHAWAVRRRECA